MPILPFNVYFHTYIHTYANTYIQSYIHININHAYIYKHTYIHSYIYIHTYIQACKLKYIPHTYTYISTRGSNDIRTGVFFRSIQDHFPHLIDVIATDFFGESHDLGN